MTRLPPLRIELAKRKEGGTILRCHRADGTQSWQRTDGAQGRFFPLHDLTHYAVESELRSSEGFFALVARGWEIDDTTGKGARGALPPETVIIERIVGMLDVERASDVEWSAADFEDRLEAAIDMAHHPALHALALSDQRLAAIRERRRTLFEQWALLSEGETLELSFPPSDPG